MTNITHKCHIIPKRYIRLFSTWWKKKSIIYVAALPQAKKRVRFKKENSEKCNFWYHIDTYNFKNELWKTITLFEDYYAEREDKISKEIHKFIERLTKKIDENIIIKINKNDKILIICSMSLILEKIVFFYFQKNLFKEKSPTNKDFFITLRCFFIFKVCLHTILRFLEYKDFKRLIIYSPKKTFYFWDIPIHIDNITNFSNFFTTPHSNIIFPISSNLMIAIENCKWLNEEDKFYKISKKWIIKDEKIPELIKKTIIERWISNLQEYIAWSNRKVIKKAIKATKKINYEYTPDTLVETMTNKMENIILPIKKEIQEIIEKDFKESEEYIINSSIEFILDIYKHFDQRYANKKILEYLNDILWNNKFIQKNESYEWIIKNLLNWKTNIIREKIETDIKNGFSVHKKIILENTK